MRSLRSLLAAMLVAALPVLAAPFAYIGNSNGNNVSVIDTATNAVVATVPVGTYPYGVGVSPTGTRVFVGNNHSNNVSVIDTASNTVIATVPVGPNPYGVAVSPAGTRAYVANGNGSSVSVIDTASNTVVTTVGVGTGPFGVAVNPAGTRVYVVNRGSQYETPTVSVIDTATNTVVGSIGSLGGAPGGTPLGIAINAAGTRAYVTNSTNSSVSVIDLATDTVVGTVSVGTGPLGVAVNPAGTLAYVANNGSSSVSVIDTATNTVIATVAVGSMPYGVAVDPAGTRAYVGSFGGNNVVVINTATNTMITGVVAGNRPMAFGLFIGGPSAGPPAISLTPPALTFAARSVGTTSSAQTVTLTNNGPGMLTISSIATGGDFAFTSACPATLAVDATCTIAVTFTPLTTGTRAGTLTIVSDASGSPHAVTLSGTGLSAAVAVIEISPSTLDFAPQGLESESPVQIVTVGNVGTGALVFGPVATSTDFVLRPVPSPAPAAPPRPSGYVGQCDVGLAPGDTCGVAIAFRPTVEGLRQGMLSISSNATQQSVAVRLVGTGIVGAPPRTLSVTESVVFGTQAVGTRSAERTVTISNNSAAAVAINELTVTGDFSVSEGCTVVAARGSCTLLLTFRPLALGERTGNLAIRTLSEVDPYNVSLAGTGVFNPLPALEISVTRVGFGNALLGSASSIAVELVNVGQVPVALGAITATGAFLAGHACGAALAVGATCPVQVSFFPRMRGPQFGVLEVTSNAAGNPHQVQLSGTGCALPSIARSRLRPVLCAP